MDRDLRDLLSAWLGEDLEPSRCDELIAKVRADDAFRQAFVDEIRMLGMLKVVHSAEPRLLRLEDELGWSASERGLDEAFEEGLARRLDDRPAVPAARRWRWGAALAAAASLLLILGVGAFSLWPRPSAPPVARRYPTVDPSRGLAMVLGLDEVDWESADEPHPVVGDVVAAGRLRFRSGRATLSMLNGVVFVVEGPADIDLVSLDQVYCHQGKLRARVPKEVEGFLVSGPGSAVLDLGTEFGLNIKPDGISRGKVFEGEVEAAVLSAAGTLRRSQLVTQASKAFEIDPGAGDIQVLNASEEFVSHLNLVPPPLSFGGSYARTVLDAKPRCYWRFESLSEGAVTNEVPGGPLLRATGPIELATTSETNRCALFKGGQETQYLEMDELWEPSRTTGFAIELWFLTEAIEHAALASLLSPKDTNHHLSLVELTSRNRLSLYRPASVRFLYRWPASRSGGENLFSRACYVPYRWHHVVAQVDGEQMELVLDGVRQFTQPLQGAAASAPCQFLLGRLTTMTEDPVLHHTGWRRAFVGRIDEVALYDHPLSSAEIQEHARQALPAPQPR